MPIEKLIKFAAMTGAGLRTGHGGAIRLERKKADIGGTSGPLGD
jgi:hypothetical protein